jgi:hypothetical protein
LSSVMGNCWEGWTAIPFTGKVQVNVTSRSGPFDLYMFTQWEGRGEQLFDSSVCFLQHPTSTSQNCGIVQTPPQCVFAMAQVFNGSYDVNLPTSLGSYYYIVFVQCCSVSATGSTVTVIMRGPSELVSSFNQAYLASISPYYVTSLNVTFNHSYASSLNISSYMSLASRTNVIFPLVLNTGPPSNTSQIPQISLVPGALSLSMSNITPGLAFFAVIELLVVGLLTKPFQHRKRRKGPKTSNGKCPQCGKALSSNSPVSSLSWDYCRFCERQVCADCLERFHNNNCELNRFS